MTTLHEEQLNPFPRGDYIEEEDEPEEEEEEVAPAKEPVPARRMTTPETLNFSDLDAYQVNLILSSLRFGLKSADCTLPKANSEIIQIYLRNFSVSD